jgi:hypothetical protein
MNSTHARRAAICLLLALMVAAAGCSRPRSWGEPWQVTVLADSADWASVGPLVEEVFAAEWIGPQPEALLDWVRGDESRLEEFLNRRNLLLLGSGPPAGPVGRFLQGLLGTEVRDRIQREEAFVFRRDGAFARDQRLVILAAPTVLSFRNQLRQQGAQVRELFLEHERTRQAADLFGPWQQQALADSLEGLHGFRLGIPADWFLVQAMEDPAFVRLRRLGPDRWITVHWIDGPDSLWASEEGLREVRRRLGRHYWDKDYTEEELGRFSQVELNGQPATLLEGLWGTDERLGGGPFLLWGLRSGGSAADSTGRSYYIDAAVLHPGGPKSPYLHQLSTIAASFEGRIPESRRPGRPHPERTTP